METPNLFANKTNTRITSEKYISKHYPEFYKFLNDKYSPYNVSFNEKIYMYKMGMDHPQECKLCGKYTKLTNMTVGYRTYCSSKCCNADPDKIQEQQNVMLQKYGVVSPSQMQGHMEKVRKTKLERYGDENYSNRDKMKQTKLERYGDENYANFEKTKQTKLERYGDAYFTNQEKRTKTNQERYGSSSPFGNDRVREKTRQTKLERYGDENYVNLKKTKQTLLERYGDENYVNLKKMKQTLLERYGDENYSNREKANKTFKQNVIYRIPELLDYDKNGDWIIECPHNECDKCIDKQFVTPYNIYYDRKRLGIEVCTKLMPIDPHSGTSLELFIRDILDEYKIEYLCNDRNILSPKELDIYIPSKKIAIECNGVFYHSSQVIRSYKQHEEKWRLCKDKGIQLLTIWEDWIKNKPDIVRSIIINKLGLCKNTLFARKCKIQEISSNECEKFLNENHIQGACKSGIRLGLTYNNELVSVMTFNKKRGMMGDKDRTKDEWELSRFCNKMGVHIPGAASKLLLYFKTHYQWTSIYSFSSNDISDGNLYNVLGFENIEGINHCYWYVDKDMHRYHRSHFSKDNIVKMGIKEDKEGWTENEVTQELNLFKIYDSGQQKWILKKEPR